MHFLIKVYLKPYLRYLQAFFRQKFALIFLKIKVHYSHVTHISDLVNSTRKAFNTKQNHDGNLTISLTKIILPDHTQNPDLKPNLVGVMVISLAI